MIESIKPQNNYVFVKLLSKNDEIKVGDKKLYIDTSWNEEHHRPIVGEVIAVPKRLVFVPGSHFTMPWRTEMQLKVGDIVTMRRPAVSACFAKSGSKFEHEGYTYIFIKYSDIILAKRELSQTPQPYQSVTSQGVEMAVIMLNGFMLIEPEEEELKTFLALPAQARKTSKLYGTIRFMGLPNLAYQPSFQTNGFEDTPPPDYEFNVGVGDRVAFYRVADIRLEDPLHASFEEGKQYFRAQRHKLLAKFD